MRGAHGGLAVSKAAVVARRAPYLRSLRLLPDRSPGSLCLRGGRAAALQEPLSLLGPRCPHACPLLLGKPVVAAGGQAAQTTASPQRRGRRAGVTHPQ